MAIVSDILQATPAPADGSPTPARTWQWLRDGAAITSATSSAYTTVDADANRSITVRQIETNFMGAASATSIAFATVDPFQVVAALFSVSEPGVWLDPSDTSTLFQDVAGTIPVTATGQTVALALDKSKGLALGPELVTSGAFAGILNVSGVGASQNIGTIAGRSYQITYRITAFSGAGTVRLALGTTGLGVPRNTLGTFSEVIFTPSGSNTQFVYAFISASTTATLDNISVKELAGNHLTQATAASRPIYGIEPFGGRRNLLVRTEEFNNAAWVKNNVTATDNVSVSGAAYSKLQTVATAASEVRQDMIINSTVAVASVYFLKGSGASDLNVIALRSQTSGTTLLAGRVDLDTGAITYITGSSGITAQLQTDGSWFVVATAAITSGHTIRFSLGSNGLSETAGEFVYVRSPQLELGSLATAYQRVTDQWNVTEAGKASVSYLAFDGTDDFLVSPTITPGIDKAQVFAGVRKLDTSSAYQCIVETSTDSRVNNGSLSVFKSGSSSQYYYITRGSLYLDATSTTSFSSPITNVLQVSSDIAQSTASAELMSRVDGVSNSLTYTNGPTAGTGNFLAYPLYVGRRGGTSLPFNGRLYQMIVRFGTNLSAERIARTEQLINEKTGAIVPPVSTLSLDFIAQEYDYGL